MSKNSHAKSKDGSWRYQAVCDEHTNDMGGTYSCFTICEVYLDDARKLEAWTENSSIAPSGETLDELAGDLKPTAYKAVGFKLSVQRDSAETF